MATIEDLNNLLAIAYKCQQDLNTARSGEKPKFPSSPEVKIAYQRDTAAWANLVEALENYVQHHGSVRFDANLSEDKSKKVEPFTDTIAVVGVRESQNMIFYNRTPQNPYTFSGIQLDAIVEFRPD